VQGGAPQDIATAPAGEVDALALVWLSLAPRAGDLGPALPRTSGYDGVSAVVRSRYRQRWLVAIHSGTRTTVVGNIRLVGPLTA